MKKITSLSLLILISLLHNAQNDLLHFMAQKKNSQSTIKEWFSKYAVESDYVYAVLLPLGSCPRCEGAIIHFFNHIKSLDSVNQSLLIAIYPNTFAATDYLKNKNYGTNNIAIIDPKDSFIDCFTFSTITVQVPYLTKFNRNSGKLLKAVSLLGLSYRIEVAEEFYQAVDPIQLSDHFTNIIIHAQNDVKGQNDFITKTDINEIVKYGTGAFILSSFKEVEIDETEIVISQVSNLSISNDLNIISIDDHLTTSTFLYHLIDSVYKIYSQYPSPHSLSREFINDDIPDQLVEYLEKTNLLHTMYLKSEIYGDKVFFSASLPNLFWEDKEKEKLGYMNKAVILSESLSVGNDFKYSSYTVFDSLSVREAGGFSHANFYVFGDSIFLPVKKGWPVSGISSAPTTNLNNPFDDAFYSNTAAFNIFSRNGNYEGTFGRLPDLHRQFKLGYAFFEPVLKRSDSKQYFMADKRTCTIYELENLNGNFMRSINLADNFQYVNIDNFNTSNPCLSYFHQISYYLDSQIIDFIVFGEKLYAILMSGDEYYLTTTSLDFQSDVNYILITKKFNDALVIPKKLKIDSKGQLFMISVLHHPKKTNVGLSVISMY